jgi:SAM-dependent methyltransferase
MSPPPRYLEHRPDDLRSTARSSQYRQVNLALHDTITKLIDGSVVPPGGVVLDFGCADQPYRELLPPHVEYRGADLEGNPMADLTIRPDGSLPLPDESVDLVLSTQVLEHVRDPAHYLREAKRVLRPGGGLVLTTHGIMYFHPDPVDYWRWTADGLRALIEEADLRVEQVEGGLGLAATAVQLFQDATFFKVPRVLRRTYATVMQAAIGLLDRPYSDEARRDNAMVLAIRARRP